MNSKETKARQEVHNLSLKMSSKETGSKAREYTSISSTASNEGFGVESELVEMPASCESEVITVIDLQADHSLLKDSSCERALKLCPKLLEASRS
ncbi:hypothetical protein ACSBR2_032061 [Camellia fascicularis]